MPVFTPVTPEEHMSQDGQQVRPGRLDDLVLAIADRVCEKSNHPMVKALYPEYRPIVESVIREHLSPEVLRKKKSKNRRRRNSQ